MRDLRSRLRPFGNKLSGPVSKLTWEQVQSYLDGLDVGERSKLNVFRHIRALLIFACKRKYAPKELLEELKAVELPKARPHPTAVFTPENLREIFAALVAYRPDLVPSITLAAFCGLRTAEIQRIDWREIRIDEHTVEVVAEKSKTASRRTVPLCAAAQAWLRPHVKAEGQVCPVVGENRLYEAVLAAVQRHRRKTGTASSSFCWVRNGFRHGFVSYRLAVTKDVNLTSLEAGNSAKMVHANYKALVSEGVATEWFSIIPPEGYGQNIIPIRTAAAATG